MIGRFNALWTIGLGTIVAGVIACGDSPDTLTLEEYFADLDAIEHSVDAQMEAVYADFPEDEAMLMEDEANLAVLKDIAGQFPVVFADFLAQLQAVDPPPEAEEWHNEMVTAAEEVVGLFDDAVEQLDGAQTITEFEALNNQIDAELGPKFTRFDDACFDLVMLAAENDIEFHLDCAE